MLRFQSTNDLVKTYLELTDEVVSQFTGVVVDRDVGVQLRQAWGRNLNTVLSHVLLTQEKLKIENMHWQ